MTKIKTCSDFAKTSRSKAKETKLNNQISLLSLSNEELDTKIKKLKSDFLASLAVEFAETQSSKTRAEAALSKVNEELVHLTY